MKTLADLVSSPTSFFYSIPARYRSLHIDEVGRNNCINTKANSASSPDKLGIEGNLHTKSRRFLAQIALKKTKEQEHGKAGRLATRNIMPAPQCPLTTDRILFQAMYHFREE